MTAYVSAIGVRRNFASSERKAPPRHKFSLTGLGSAIITSSRTVAKTTVAASQ